MSVTDLELFKRHCRVDFTDDDANLQSILDGAEEFVVRATNRELSELLALGDGENLPPSLIRAVLALGNHWYDNPAAVSATQMHAVPYGIEALIKPWRRLV